MSDYEIENHGTVFLVRPQNGTARDWLEEHVDEEAQWFGGALVVEHRYIEDLAANLANDGFIVKEAAQ